MSDITVSRTQPPGHFPHLIVGDLTTEPNPGNALPVRCAHCEELAWLLPAQHEAYANHVTFLCSPCAFKHIRAIWLANGSMPPISMPMSLALQLATLSQSLVKEQQRRQQTLPPQEP